MSEEPDNKEWLQLRSSLLSTDLEQTVFSLVAQPLYETEARQQMRVQIPASDDEIDEMLTSSGMKRALRRAAEAFLQQQMPGLLGMICKEAQGRQTWACKLILELTGLAELLRTTVVQTEGDSQETWVLSEIERGLVESFRQLVAGEVGDEAQQGRESK